MFCIEAVLPARQYLRIADITVISYCSICLLGLNWRAWYRGGEEEAKIALLPVSGRMIDFSIGFTHK